MSALYYQAHQGDGFREPGFSRERRPEPQITTGLLTGQDGFPLMLSAFEGNRAETKIMLPVTEAFTAARRLPDVTVAAEAGMISDANMKATEAAGLSFILGMKVPDVPYVIGEWRRQHPGEEVPGGRVFTRPWPAGPKDKRRDQVTCCQYRAGRARRTPHGTGGQAARAARAVAGPAPVKRNRFTAPDGAVNSVDRELEARARTPAGIRGCKASLAAAPDGTPVTADLVIGPYHELWRIEKSFRMPEPGLRAGPVCRRRRDSVEAPLTAASAALAVTRFTGARTGWPAGKFVRTARRCRTVQVRAGQRTITAEDPLPPGGRDALALIK